jgi:thiol-disulfide isomerase/thioredoxin
VLKRDPVVLIVLAMVASLLLVFGFNKVREAPTPEALAAAKMKGQPAHEFALQTTEGKVIHLSDLRGRAVVLNFWATWCEPCKIEMPWLMELQKQYGAQELQVVGVQMNDDAAVEDVASFAKGMGIGYLILVGKRAEQNAIANDYGGIAFLPETVFITRDGKISEKTIGLRSKPEIEESIQQALAQAPNKTADGPSGPAGRLSGASAAAVKPTSE